MRLITILGLGAATLICCGAPLAAPNTPAGAEPAVIPAASPAAAQPQAPAPAGDQAGPAKAANDQVAVAEPAKPYVFDASPSDDDSIVATVNDKPITEFELRDRLALYLATNPTLKPTEADVKRLRGEMLKNLEEEKIELAEARDKHVSVSPVTIDSQINDFLTQQHHTLAQLRKQLEVAGSSMTALRNQFLAMQAWRQLVEQQFTDDATTNITPAMVDDQMKRDAIGANKAHYLVSEIFLPVDSPDQDAKVKKTMEGIVTQIKEGAPFPEVAREYSRNPSAAMNGSIGWVYDGQLDPELNSVLAKMSSQQMSDPIRGKGGYYLLALQQRQEPLGTNVNIVEQPVPTGPPGTLPLARMLLPMSGATQAQIDEAMKVAVEIQHGVASCDQLQKVADDMKGSVFAKLGDFRVSDLDPGIQKGLAETKSGEIATPVMSSAGIEIIARCDKRASAPKIAFTLPPRGEVENRLFQDQLSTLARRYMRDLKRDANIQERGADGEFQDALLK